MTPELTSITLSEWQTLGPSDCSQLVGRFLDTSPRTRKVVERLTESNLLGLTEMRHGLQIKAYSHVGRIRIGDLNITVLPKIKGNSLLSLIRYAYGFRRLNLVSDSTHLIDRCGFEDLLIIQLIAEVQELVSRGLSRAYIGTSERMSSPRGRIDLARMALDGGTVKATLPCLHYPRIEDSLLNQLLMAGLRLASIMASTVHLRCESLRLASCLEEKVSSIRLDRIVLERVEREVNRLTKAYSPAIAIIRLLIEAQGIVFEGQNTKTTLPGFMFDMNTFFQALVSRFLKDNLLEYSVHDEVGLKGMMRYSPMFNPQRRMSPTPRPDYVLTHQGKIVSILDAKYRDLWERQLPSEMLYQLVVYAISNPKVPQSSILYPTTNAQSKEARINITHPISGKFIGEVCLRPVHIPTIVELVATKNSQRRRDSQNYAKLLAFGSTNLSLNFPVKPSKC